MRSSVLAVLTSLLVAGTKGAGVAVDVPPFVFTGRIVNSGYEDLAATVSGAEIRVRKQGALLARSSIQDVSGTTCNYSLTIPMTSSAASSTAAVAGDSLTFEIDDGKNVYSYTNGATVGSPGRVARLDFVASQDSDGDGVPDAYAATVGNMKDLYPELGLSGTNYEASADYDKDGVSNYQEYLAGTNPFDADDAFKIIAFTPAGGETNLMALTFISGKNRIYSAQKSGEMGKTSFAQTTFRKEGTARATEENYFQTAVEEDYVKTIYVLRSGDSQMFRMKME